MSGFTITREMLVEAAGCDPYELRTEFKNDTDPEAVDALSSIFKNGAEEAAESGSVSQYASELEEGAGTRGIHAIYEDGAAHLEQTYDDLGEAGLRTVSATLGEIKDEMEATRTYVDDSIVGEMGLEYWREWYAGQANEEISAFERELNGLDQETEFTWSGYGESYKAKIEEFPRSKVHSVIEKEYTKRAGEYGADVHDRMTNELDDYYGFLSNREQRLAEDGYDTGSTPLDLWQTEGRAEYEGEQLALELQKDNPDPLAVARYSRGVEELVGEVFDENGEPVRELTAAERAYLSSFYDGLGAEGMAALGAAGADPNRDGPATVETIANAQEAVANGLMGLFDPEAGGYTSVDDEGAPEAVRDLVRDLHLGDGSSGSQHATEDTVDNLSTYRDFARLMDDASFEAPAEFGAELGESALRIQQEVNQIAQNNPGYDFGGQAEPGDMTGLDTGASTMLGVVAKSVDASQTFLDGDTDRGAEPPVIDNGNITALVGTEWWGAEDGALELLDAATERGQDSPERAQLAANITHRLFAELGSDATTWRALLPKGGPMSDAVTELAAEYIDAFAADLGHDSQGAWGFDPEQRGDEFFGSFRMAGMAGEGITGVDFLHQFIAAGNDPNDPEGFMQDTDLLTLEVAAQNYSVNRLAAGLDSDGLYGEAMQDVANLDGTLAAAHYRSVVDYSGNFDSNEELIHERRALMIDLAADILVSNPVGTTIEKISNETVKTLVETAYGEADTSVRELLSGKPELISDENKRKLLTEFTDERNDGINYYVASALHETGRLVNEDGEPIGAARGLLAADGSLIDLPELRESGKLDDLMRLASSSGGPLAAERPWNSNMDERHWEGTGEVMIPLVDDHMEYAQQYEAGDAPTLSNTGVDHDLVNTVTYGTTDVLGPTRAELKADGNAISGSPKD
ncbi:TPR repeat region-containing protein [Streptomyces parvus]|uniref:TPR repeat region-containing protein n=1 Tax=Streptomyces parvus TaxID=66428 RepID=UPI0036962381